MDLAQKFQLWYKEPIETLIAKDEHTGFAVLTLTLPILERYVRHRVGITEHKLSDEFHDELVRLFPDFKNRGNAIEFWKRYRHGLLHQATLQGDLTFLKSDGPILSCWNGKFGVSANKFAKRVLSIIGTDLATFASTDDRGSQLPTVQETAGRSGVFKP